MSAADCAHGAGHRSRFRLSTCERRPPISTDLQRRSTSAMTRKDAARATRELSALEVDTRMRLATVQAEGFVQAARMGEIDALAREAMIGQATLVRWSESLAGNDPFLADQLRLFVDAARLGKAEIVADTIATFRREARR
jgi:hypothetical protein